MRCGGCGGRCEGGELIRCVVFSGRQDAALYGRRDACRYVGERSASGDFKTANAHALANGRIIFARPNANQIVLMQNVGAIADGTSDRVTALRIALAGELIQSRNAQVIGPAFLRRR